MAQDPYIYCLLLLKRRLKSRYELEQALERRKFDEDASVQAIKLLMEQGLVDDIKFARAWVNTRDALNPRGKSVLRMELLKKGIAKEIINQALKDRDDRSKELPDEYPNEIQLAQRLVDSKKRVYANLTDEVRNRRLMSMLARRGFSYDVIRRILNT